MNNWEYIWEAFINLFESSLFLIFITDHLSSRIFISKYFSSIIKLLFVILDSCLTDYMNYNNFTTNQKLLIGLITYTLFSVIMYNDSAFKKVIFPCIYNILLLLSENLTFLSLCLFLNANLNEFVIGGLLRVPATLVYILTIAIFIFLIHYFQKNDPSVPAKRKYIYLIYCAIGLLFCIYTSAITIKSNYLFEDISFTKSMIIISSFFTIIFFLLLLYIYNLSCEREKNQKLIEERQQLILEEAEYNNLLELTDSLRQFKHDVQHHLNAISYISQNGTISELNKYVKNYSAEIENTHKFISSGNTAIDSILTSKIPLAESKGINVSYALSIPETFTINPVNITTILGNLWNNAIEACEQQLTLENGSSIAASIDFYIKPVNNMLLISIENTFNGIVSISPDGSYSSTKKVKNEHGLGLKRVISITKQNDGLIDISNDDSNFYVHIMFPIQGEFKSCE